MNKIKDSEAATRSFWALVVALFEPSAEKSALEDNRLHVQGALNVRLPSVHATCNQKYMKDWIRCRAFVDSIANTFELLTVLLDIVGAVVNPISALEFVVDIPVVEEFTDLSVWLVKKVGQKLINAAAKEVKEHYLFTTLNGIMVDCP